MFGYVIPDKPNMFVKDFTLYRAFYCGLCKTIGKAYSQLMRFTTNYDMTFLYVFYCAVKKIDVEISNETCVLSPLRKKSILKDCEAARIVSDISTLLTFYKLRDNVCDEGGLLNRTAFSYLKRYYKRASSRMSEVDKIIKAQYEKIFELEKNNCSSIDMVADPFAKMLEKIGESIFCEDFTQNIGKVLYNIGKWIYVVDAIDDIEEDFKAKNFNPFLINYTFESREKFLKDKEADLSLTLYGCYDEIQKQFDNIKIEKYEGILTNILWYGLLQQTKEILGRTVKCKQIRI